MFRYIVQLIDAMVYPLLIITVIWLVFFIDHGYGLELNYYGLRPHEWRGLLGIVSMPFLHGDFDHLFSNSVPLALSMGFLFLYFPLKKWRIILWTYLLTGVLTWFIADAPSVHIGASGLVYAFIAFLVTHSVLSKNKESIAASLILLFLYGGLVYGLFPEYGRLIGKNISWEGHLSGTLVGMAMGFIHRNNGPQQKVYFEDEEDDDEDEPFEPYQDEDGAVVYRLRYHIRPEPKDPAS